MQGAYEAFIAAPTDDHFKALSDAMRTFHDDTVRDVIRTSQERKGPPVVMIERGRIWVLLPAYGQFVSGDPTTGKISWRAQNDDGTMASEGGVSDVAATDIDFWDAACDAIAVERAGR